MCKLLVLGFASSCIGSACVTPTYASSAPLSLPSTETGVILTHIYPATEGGALHELIAVYNNTDSPVDMTGWCLVSRTHAPLFCFGGSDVQSAQIAPYTRAVIVSSEYAAGHEGTAFDGVFTVASKTSGSLVGSSGELQLLDSLGRQVDWYEWKSTAPSGRGYSREMPKGGVAGMPLIYSSEHTLDTRVREDVVGGPVTYSDLGESPDAPEESPGGATGHLEITELLPNPKGSDAGNEFIELYNASDKDLDMGTYVLRITGGSSGKRYVLPSLVLRPGEYAAVFNVDLKYALPNEAGSVALLFAPDGVATLSAKPVAVVEYSDPEEALSYAYFVEDDMWAYTTTPTPGKVNVLTLREEGVEVEVVCASGQFRNPSTGRCKKIEVAAVQSPCKAGQYRNSETGRCRNVATTNTSAPCKAGQERNLETGRCRNVKKMTSAGNAPAPKPEVTAGGVAWYAWVFAGLIIVAVLGYAVWEWREEIRHTLLKFKK